MSSTKSLNSSSVKDMKFLAIIPARGGSKRIEHKNIKDFCGAPVIAYSIRAALRAGCFSRVLVSTDDAEIARVAVELGAEVPFMRSDKTSDDFATTADVINEVLDCLEVKGETYDAIACIYATAPFITPERLRDAVAMIERSEAQSVFTCVEYSYPIQRSLAIGEDGRISMRYPEYAGSRSQDLPKTYHDAGQFYVSTVRSFRDCGSLWGPDTRPIVLPELEVQDLDTITDWKLAEMKFRLLGRVPVEQGAPIFPSEIRLGDYLCESYTVMNDRTSLAMLSGRNNPEVRSRMVDTNPISEENHRAFVQSLRTRTDKAYYAVSLNGGEIVGSFNMEWVSPGRMERGIWIDPSQWGKGHAAGLLSRVYDYFHRVMGVDVIETKIRYDNEASQCLERKLGAVALRRDGAYIYYETKLAD